MSEVMAQRQPVKPTYSIPLVPIANSSQFKHQEAMDMKEFKVNKVIRMLVIFIIKIGVKSRNLFINPTMKASF